MEFLSNLFNPLKERVKSPFYSTLFISWLACNWKVFFAVIFLKQEDYYPYDVLRYIEIRYLDFTECETWFFRVLLPILITLLYFFCFPKIDRYFNKLQARSKRKKILDTVKIGRQYPVSGELHYRLKLEFEKEKERVIKFEEREMEWQTEINNCQSQINELKSNVESFKAFSDGQKNELDALKKGYNITDVFPGRWKLTYEMKDKEGKFLSRGEEEFSVFHPNDYGIYRSGQIANEFKVFLSHRDLTNKKIGFVKYCTREGVDNGTKLINQLTIVSDNIYEGFEGVQGLEPISWVRYERIN